MQNGSVVRGSKNRSDIWQFRWWEKTSDGMRVYRGRVIGTVDRVQDLEAAREAARLLVPGLELVRSGISAVLNGLEFLGIQRLLVATFICSLSSLNDVFSRRIIGPLWR